MKIAISSTRPDLDAEVEFQFSKCKYLTIIDLENMSFEVIPNRKMIQSNSVGPQLAKIIANKGVKAVLTGMIDSNTRRPFTSLGIKIITDISGIVRVVAYKYKNQLKNNAVDKERAFISEDSFYRYTIFVNCFILADYI